jgi:hypothetical protein
VDGQLPTLVPFDQNPLDAKRVSVGIADAGPIADPNKSLPTFKSSADLRVHCTGCSRYACTLTSVAFRHPKHNSVFVPL